MNNLSWLLYAADVAGSLSLVSSFTASISFLVSLTLFGFVAAMDTRHEWRKTAKKTSIFSCVASLVAVLTPSSDTVYAIAASEVGEEVLESETGSKAISALNAWLDRQLEDDTNGNP